MEPVVGEVVGEEEEDPDPPVAWVEPERSQLVDGDIRGEDRELPDEVDRHVPKPHRQRGLGVPRLEPDQVFVVVVAEVAVRQILHREERQEVRNRVVEDLRHEPETVPPAGDPACQLPSP